MINFLEIFLNNAWVYLNPLIEIAVLFTIIYSALYYLRGTRGSNILAGLIIMLILLTFASDLLEFEVISWLLNGLWAILAAALIVIFQPELRRAFAQLGSRPFLRRLRKKEAINEVVTAVINMANQRTGALIVFERDIGMRAIVNSAVRIDARLSHHLLQSVFYRNSPLHDGAVIVRGNVIIAAHCILPLSQNEIQVQSLGTRHRAAIGITEETDAVAVVVSEETGIISIACRGRLKRNISPDKLARFLHTLLRADENKSLKEILGSVGGDDEDVDGGFSSSSLKDK